MRAEVDVLAASVSKFDYRTAQLTISRVYHRGVRKHPIWELRYRFGDLQSDKSLGRAWEEPGASPPGYLNAEGAKAAAYEFLAGRDPDAAWLIES